MKQKTIPYFLLLCWLLVGSLFSPVYAQVFLSGNALYADGGSGLETTNNIVWGNVTGSVLSGDNNFTDADADPLFASETDFALRAGSPAAGGGKNSAWDALGLSPAVDIAGAPHATPMSIGAYEVGTINFKVSYDGGLTGGLVLAYLNNKSIAAGTDIAQGSELIVTATPATGYRLLSLLANGGKIENGETFILTGDVEFSAEFEESSRKNVYGTMQEGGTLSVVNSIVYDNVDLFGNYSLDKTNVIADPKFTDLTDFTLEVESPALGLGDGGKILTGFEQDVAGTPLNALELASGAYQPSLFTVSWQVSGNGSLEVVRVWTNESKEKVEDPLTNSKKYPQGTVIVRATPAAGYKLSVLKVNGGWINVADEQKNPEKELLLLEGSFPLTGKAEITAEFTQMGGMMPVAVQVDESSTLVNNIIYDNLHSPSNRVENPQAPTNYTEDPKFVSLTNFAIQSISPVINKGINVAENTTYAKDLANRARVQGGVVDMGAFESVSDGFIVTYNKEITAKGIRVATVELQNLDNNNVVIASGESVPAGTNIHVSIQILNENYERIQRIRLNDGVKDEYLTNLDATTFTLKSNTSVNVAIQAKEYIVNYESTHAQILVYNGSALVANGAKIGYGTILSVIVNPETGKELRFVVVNGKHIDGAEKANGYAVKVEGDVTITTNAQETSLIGTEGIISWDALNAMVTVTDKDGSLVELGSSHAPGTPLNVKIEPLAATGYKLVLIEVNGQSRPYTEFTVEIPPVDGGNVATTFIGVRYEKMTQDEIAQEPDPTPVPGASYVITTAVTGNGTLTLKNAQGGVVQPGQSVTSGTILTLEAVSATGYALNSLTVNDKMALSGSEITVLETTTISALFEKEVDPTQPAPDPATQKQVYITVQGSGTVTLQHGITAASIESGDWVDNNTSIVVSTTANNGYKLTSIQALQGNTDVLNNGIFSAAATTYVVAVFDREADNPTPPVIPPMNPNPTPEYVTLTIGGSLPAGITINPAGTQTVEKGSSLTLRLSVDERPDGKYIYLKINGEYVLLRANTSDLHSLVYTLVNITAGMTVDVVVTDTPDPDPDDPSGNAVIENTSRIWTEGGQVCIQTETPGSVRIVTFNGRVVTNRKLSAGETRIPLADGFYIVALSDGTTAKVAVRNF